MATNPLRASLTRKSADHIRAADAVQAMTRKRFKLPDDAPIMVLELPAPARSARPCRQHLTQATDRRPLHVLPVVPHLGSMRWRRSVVREPLHIDSHADFLHALLLLAFDVDDAAARNGTNEH